MATQTQPTEREVFNKRFAELHPNGVYASADALLAIQTCDINYFERQIAREKAATESRAASVAEQSPKYAPDATELGNQLQSLHEQQNHWQNVLTEATSDCAKLKGILRAANTVITECQGKIGSQYSSDRDEAGQVIERTESKLEAAERRRDNASKQVKVRAERLKDFPHSLYRKLKTEEARREELRRNLHNR